MGQMTMAGLKVGVRPHSRVTRGAKPAVPNGTALALLAAMLALDPAIAVEPEKWGAHLDFEGRWGNARSLGDAGLFAPLWQKQTALLFTDIRGRFDSQDGREGNFGLGYRRMLSSGWNLGVYGYYDVRRTGYGNMLNQVTLGAEMLSADWDLRANLYAPFGARSRQIGVVGGDVINAANASSFAPVSTGNSVSGTIGGIRCGGDGTASGPVVFTDDNDCYP